MKKIFVKLLAVLLVAVLALPLLCSCGEQGEAGPAGEAGKDGAAGKSAYELAVENGFNGTLEQWIASLAGVNGAVGATGAAGTNGKDGTDGKDGRIGFVVTSEAELLTALTVNNAYVVLANDITTADKEFTVPAGVNAVLNLNGKTVKSTWANKYTVKVEVNGILTIIGNGTITNNDDETSTPVQNYGTLIIGEKDVAAAPTITTGTKTENTNSALKCEETSTTIIYNGTFGGHYRSVQSYGVTLIYGGTFNKRVEAWKYKDNTSCLTILGGTFNELVCVNSSGKTDYPVGDNGAHIDIYGGTFNGKVKVMTGEERGNNEYTGPAGTMTISGGTYTGEADTNPVAAYLKGGYAALYDADNEKWTVSVATAA